mgnify:FL=1
MVQYRIASLYMCDTFGHYFSWREIEPDRPDLSHLKLSLRQDAYSQRDFVTFC